MTPPASLPPPRNLYSPNDLSIFNNLKGLAIFLVILYHCPGSHLADGMLPFMMPCFAFASGFYAKGDTLAYVKKIFSLLFVFALICIPEALYDSRMSGVNLFLKNFSAHFSGGWFFVALILWKTILPVFRHLRYPLVLSFIFCAIFYVLFLAARWGLENLSIELRGVRFFLNSGVGVWSFFPAFILGSMMEWKWIVALRHFKWRWMLLLPAGMVFYLSFSKKLVYIMHYPAINYFLQFSLFSVASFCMIAALIACLPGKRLPLFTEAGQRSLSIYLLHIWWVLPVFHTISKSKPFQWLAISPYLTSLFLVSFSLFVLYIGSHNICFNTIHRIAAGIENLLFAPSISAQKAVGVASTKG